MALSLSSPSLLLYLRSPLRHSLQPCIIFRSDFSSFPFLLFDVRYCAALSEHILGNIFAYSEYPLYYRTL